MPADAPAARVGPILLIDDDVEALAIFEQILRDAGFEVRKAATAEAGLLELEVATPAAVLVDLRLPALDGLDCLRRIRATPRLAHTPVTIMTADYLIDESVVAQIEAMGARLCFKPLWEDDVLHIVRAATAP
ncbi:MAG TPA: response regulator [Vicinamibacterales bacterium]|nr:response regulator [Vicinamibacterales bacterium]